MSMFFCGFKGRDYFACASSTALFRLSASPAHFRAPKACSRTLLSRVLILLSTKKNTDIMSMFLCCFKGRDYFACASSTALFRLSASPVHFRAPKACSRTLLSRVLILLSTKKNTDIMSMFLCWRKGRDSNSGWDRSHDGFQDRCIKPLCHLSILTMCFTIISLMKTVTTLSSHDGLRLRQSAIPRPL